MSLEKKLSAFLADLETGGDRELQYEILLEIAERFEDVSPKVAARPFPKEHRVPACESDAYVWVTALPEGGVEPHYAVENPQGVSAKALSVILKEACTGASPEEVSSLDESIVTKIFGEGISMGKGEGLRGIVRSTKVLAGKFR